MIVLLKVDSTNALPLRIFFFAFFLLEYELFLTDFISDSFSDDRPIQFHRSSSDCDHIRVHVDHGGVDWIDCS